MRPSRGFTLLEILVALVVLAIALTATARGIGASIDVTAELRERTLARWVAEDQLAQLELTRAFPPLDTTEGDAEMGGRKYRWSRQVSSTPVARMRRVEFTVFVPGAETPVARLTGFLEQP